MEELVREKLEGKSYSQIRAELRAHGMEEEEIGKLIRQVDQKVLETELRGHAPDRPRQWYLAGLVLAISGLILSVVYNAGWIIQGIPALAVYAPFLLGILFMLYGKTLRRTASRKKDREPGAIRKRRPFK